MSETSPWQARPVRVVDPLYGLGVGTGVLTAEGELPVEYLEPGDRIVTRDGVRRLARVRRGEMEGREMIRLRPAALLAQDGTPEARLAAGTLLLVRGWRARAMFGRNVALVEARRLADGAHIATLDGAGPIALFQLVFDDGPHLVQIAGGRYTVASSPMTPARAAARW